MMTYHLAFHEGIHQMSCCLAASHEMTVFRHHIPVFRKLTFFIVCYDVSLFFCFFVLLQETTNPESALTALPGALVLFHWARTDLDQLLCIRWRPFNLFVYVMLNLSSWVSLMVVFGIVFGCWESLNVRDCSICYSSKRNYITHTCWRPKVLIFLG